MPKRKAEGAVSDHEDDYEEVPASKMKSNSGDAHSIVACELSKNRKVVVRKFKGKVMIDIREFWSKDGEDLPSKKGISLPIEQKPVEQACNRCWECESIQVVAACLIDDDEYTLIFCATGKWEVFRDHIKDVQKVIETLN